MRPKMRHPLFHVDRMEASLITIECHSIHHFIYMSRLRLRRSHCYSILCLSACHCVSLCSKAVPREIPKHCIRVRRPNVMNGSILSSVNLTIFVIAQSEIRNPIPSDIPQSIARQPTNRLMPVGLRCRAKKYRIRPVWIRSCIEKNRYRLCRSRTMDATPENTVGGSNRFRRSVVRAESSRRCGVWAPRSYGKAPDHPPMDFAE
jgi:hypothetical protein